LRQRFQHFCFYLVSEPVSFAHRELTIHDDVKVYADSAPDPSLESKVRAIAANQRDKCHVRKMGLSFYGELPERRFRLVPRQNSGQRRKSIT